MLRALQQRFTEIARKAGPGTSHTAEATYVRLTTILRQQRENEPADDERDAVLRNHKYSEEELVIIRQIPAEQHAGMVQIPAG